jgi:hypothetical protein
VGQNLRSHEKEMGDDGRLFVGDIPVSEATCEGSEERVRK